MAEKTVIHNAEAVAVRLRQRFDWELPKRMDLSQRAFGNSGRRGHREPLVRAINGLAQRARVRYLPAGIGYGRETENFCFTTLSGVGTVNIVRLTPKRC